jgi:hypothetical protein
MITVEHPMPVNVRSKLTYAHEPHYGRGSFFGVLAALGNCDLDRFVLPDLTTF